VLSGGAEKAANPATTGAPEASRKILDQLFEIAPADDAAVRNGRALPSTLD